MNLYGPAYRLAHRIRVAYWKITNPKTFGVKIIALNSNGNFLLIRNVYGNRAVWSLPGGKIGRKESPEYAVEREMMEEVGLSLNKYTLFSTYVSSREGKTDTIYLFFASADDMPIKLGKEIEEAKFFSLSSLPDKISPATLRRIQEFHRGEVITKEW